MRLVEGIRGLFHAMSIRPSIVLCALLMVLVAHASVAEDVVEEEYDWPPPDHEMLFEVREKSIDIALDEPVKRSSGWPGIQSSRIYRKIHAEVALACAIAL